MAGFSKRNTSIRVVGCYVDSNGVERAIDVTIQGDESIFDRLIVNVRLMPRFSNFVTRMAQAVLVSIVVWVVGRTLDSLPFAPLVQLAADRLA